MPTDISLLSASAGSGKTHSLTERLVQLIGKGVRPDGVVATTFTRKAAGELTARVRAKLLAAGRPAEARRIGDGYIGTVNSVCGAILKDYAFEAGLSPALDVLPEGEDAEVFRTSISEVIRNNAQRLAAVCGVLELADDWGETIKGIADKARVNGIDRAGLLRCIAPSWDSLRPLLPDALTDEQGRALDQELAEELTAAIAGLPAPGDSTAATQNVRKQLLAVSGAMRDGRPPTWATWVRLAGVSPGKKSAPVVEVLRELAGQVLAHPQFQRDLREAIRLFFECAADALGRYQQYKKDLGLIDFIDQEMRTLELLQGGEARRRLEERLDLLLVDEFQDTSPIQLALFLRLAETAGRSVWVGDQKQSIFAFRGADPVLMEAVMRGIGNVQVLNENWRSQPALVAFTSSLFSRAMARHGIPDGHVRLSPRVAALPTHTPNLKCWRLDAKNKAQDWTALAAGIRKALEEPGQWPVLDKQSKQGRPLKAGDIAVLCLQRTECKGIATALEAVGVRAATSAPGLMRRPETALALAAFRVLTDTDDLLAVAEMARLMPQGGDPAWWLLHCAKGDLSGVVERLEPVRKLEARRGDLARLTVTEMLDLAMELAGVRRVALAWTGPEKRLGNLDALRGYAAGYEDLCTSRRTPCTPAGLLSHLADLEADEDDGQAEGVGEDAVQVLTYHRSKGLEWPVVVLTGLNSFDKFSVFGLNVVSPEGELDFADPLAGRWLRYWPWPFGLLKGMSALNEALAASSEQSHAREQASRERLRLLYVGMTRARDHMVLAARVPRNVDESTTAWLDSCVDEQGNPIVSLPSEEGEHVLVIGEESFPIAVTVQRGEETLTKNARKNVWAPATPHETVRHPAARFVPGTERFNGQVTTEVVTLGPALDLPAAVDPLHLGRAVHACLAAVPMSRQRGNRLARTTELLAEWGVATLSAEAFCTMQERLAEFVRERYPEASPVVEWPIHLRRGLRRGSGWVDLLLRLPEGNVIIDHKTGMGDHAALQAKTVDYAGQLAAYSEALAKATGLPTLGIWVHFPLAGGIVKLAI